MPNEKRENKYGWYVLAYSFQLFFLHFLEIIIMRAFSLSSSQISVPKSTILVSFLFFILVKFRHSLFLSLFVHLQTKAVSTSNLVCGIPRVFVLCIFSSLSCSLSAFLRRGNPFAFIFILISFSQSNIPLVCTCL